MWCASETKKQSLFVCGNIIQFTLGIFVLNLIILKIESSCLPFMLSIHIPPEEPQPLDVWFHCRTNSNNGKSISPQNHCHQHAAYCNISFLSILFFWTTMNVDALRITSEHVVCRPSCNHQSTLARILALTLHFSMLHIFTYILKIHSVLYNCGRWKTFRIAFYRHIYSTFKCHGIYGIWLTHIRCTEYGWTRKLLCGMMAIGVPVWNKICLIESRSRRNCDIFYEADIGKSFDKV